MLIYPTIKMSPLLGLQGSGGGLGFLAGNRLELPDFPSAYESWIATYAGNPKRYYDPINGNDSNSGNTPETAKQNVGTDMNSFLQGGNTRLVVLLPGTHTVTTDGPGSYGGRMFQWDTTNSSVIGAPGKTIVRNATSGGGGDARDLHVFGMRSGSATVIGLIIERDNEGRGTNYSRAMWGYDASATSGDVYNCVIRETNGNNTMSHIYDNQGSGDREMYNCLIDATMEGAYTCGTTYAENCAFTHSSHNFCSPGVTNATLNVTTGNAPSGLPYYINNGANNSSFGVYSGTYAWPVQ
tara:strand:+ start:2995 stop:3882 length:888 start_codon:yes stop_codon:yes gene_type:complete